jgi:hypothetical protein
MSVVVAVCEHDVLRRAVLLEPLQTFVRDRRIDRDTLPLEVDSEGNAAAALEDAYGWLLGSPMFQAVARSPFRSYRQSST